MESLPKGLRIIVASPGLSNSAGTRNLDSSPYLMSRYLIRQFGFSLLKLFLFVTLMFFFVQIVMPGDFVDQFSLTMTVAQREALRAELGLNLPLGQQYLHWLGRLARADLGLSFYGHPINAILRLMIPMTLLVFFNGTIIAFWLGMQLGKVTAWQLPKPISQLITVASVTPLISFPPWIAWLLAYAVGRRVSFLRVGFNSIGVGILQRLDRDVWRSTTWSPDRVALLISAAFVVGILAVWLINRRQRTSLRASLSALIVLLTTLFVLLIAGALPQALDLMRLAWLPLVTYILISMGETLLIMQTSMRELRNAQFAETARAKGLSPAQVRDRHIVRNALLPVLSRLMITLPFLLTGIVIIEDVLSWPGVGSALWKGLYWQDMPLVLAIMLIVGVLSLVGRLVLDVIYAWLDPRIRFGASA